MIISHRHKFVFIPIPKTGSTSIRNILSEYNCVTPTGDNKSLLYHHTSADRAKLYFHEQQYVLDRLPVRESDWVWDNYFKFTFVRNPFARLVSQYIYTCKLGNGTQTIPCSGTKSGTFKLPTKYYEACKRVAELKFDQFVKKPSMRAYWDVTYGWYGLKHFNYIGKTETLQQDFDQVIETLNDKYDAEIPLQQLPLLNTTTHKHYSEYYDKESREIVSRVYKNDLTRFNYKFESSYT